MTSYDADGNRLSDGSGSYAYGPASNKLAARKGVAVTTDAAGHITSDGLGHAFAYNQAGRLYQVYQGTTLLASYYYDYKGERTRKVTTAAAPQGAGTVFYHYDEAGHLIEESAGNGSPIRTYIWRDDVPLAQIDHVPSRRVLYFDVDQLNTPRAARDQSGNVVWRWESDAFGSTAPTANAGVVVNLRFPGQYYDQESGLDYNQNRDYDPNSGRYAESDPIGLKGGVNTYAYVNGNPLSYIDPSGQNPAIVAGAILGGISGGWGAIASSGSGPINWGKVAAATAVGAGSGAVIGALAPAIIVTGGVSAFIDTAAANVGIRAASSMGGNLVGQYVSYATDPSGFQFSAGSLIGSGVSGAFNGTSGVGAAMARAEGWISGSLASRLVAGTPGVIAAAGISAENAPRNNTQRSNVCP